MRPPFCPTGKDDDDSGGFRPPFGPFGRHRGGPFGRKRGGRVFDSGALRLLVLSMIGEEPRHGYDIIKGLRQRFQGAYAPSPGAIYPILQMLEEAGLAVPQAGGFRKRYAITPAGSAYLESERQDLERILGQVAAAAEPIGVAAIGEAIQEFRAALFRKMRKGDLTDVQATRLRDALRRAQDEIENI